MKKENQIISSQTKKLFQKSVNNELTCCICLDILDNPVMCSNCLNNFCDKCIKKWEDDYNFYCPFKCKFPKYYSNLKIKLILMIIKMKIKKNIILMKINTKIKMNLQFIIKRRKFGN